MIEFCYAYTAEGAYRNTDEAYKGHKPVAGQYDGCEILTCAWCGKRIKPSQPNDTLEHSNG